MKKYGKKEMEKKRRKGKSINTEGFRSRNVNGSRDSAKKKQNHSFLFFFRQLLGDTHREREGNWVNDWVTGQA